MGRWRYRVEYTESSNGSQTTNGLSPTPGPPRRCLRQAARPEPRGAAGRLRTPGGRSRRGGRSLACRVAPFEPSGLGVGHLVGLSAPNGPGFLAGLLALRRAGAAVLMLDHGAPAGEWQRAAQGLGARAVLSAEAWPEGPEGFRLSTLPAPHQTLPQAVGVVKLTSGSTGAPRGVSVSMEALLADDSALASSMGLRMTTGSWEPFPSRTPTASRASPCRCWCADRCSCSPRRRSPWRRSRPPGTAERRFFPRPRPTSRPS